jgi:hypothetical protein
VSENDNGLRAVIGGQRGGDKRIEVWVEAQDGSTVAGPWQFDRGNGFSPNLYNQNGWNVGGQKYRLVMQNNGVSTIRIELNGVTVTEGFGGWQNISGVAELTYSNLALKSSGNDLNVSLAGFPRGSDKTVTLKLTEGGGAYDNFFKTGRNVVSWDANSRLVTPAVVSSPSTDPIYIYVLNPDETIVSTQFRVEFRNLDPGQIKGIAGIGPEKWREIF